MAVAVATDRRIIGTPTQVGSGTIRVRATNDGGTADWTVNYSHTASSWTTESMYVHYPFQTTHSGSLKIHTEPYKDCHLTLLKLYVFLMDYNNYQ